MRRRPPYYIDVEISSVVRDCLQDSPYDFAWRRRLCDPFVLSWVVSGLEEVIVHHQEVRLYSLSFEHTRLHRRNWGLLADDVVA